MKITGIICEYNPLHLGHKKQLDLVRAADPEGGIVCLMSGNYVQRGAPAIVDKMARAKAAVLCGADLVVELPVTVSLSSAEGFADGGVEILSGFCDRLCFGAESKDKDALMHIAKVLLSDAFKEALHIQLDQGLSFPVARQSALESMGLDATVLQLPNNILAVEYCKAILRRGQKMEIMPIFRGGDYHAREAEQENPSATAIRNRMLTGQDWDAYIPKEAAVCFENAQLHSIDAAERAILYRLRTMNDERFEALPYGSEGLWRKLMHAARQESTLEAIIAATKSKRYTRTRIDRMILCAFLGITEKMLLAPAPYARVLAFNDKGRDILKTARQTGHFPNIGEVLDHPYQILEDRCGSLYGLFAQGEPGRPDAQSKDRIYCQRG